MVKYLKKYLQKCYHLYALRDNVDAGEGLHLGVGSIAWAPHRLEIGKNVYIGKYCAIECDGRIGDNVMIANHVGLIGRYDHDYAKVGVPIRQAPWIGDSRYDGPGKGLEIVIEDDVWVGFGAVILSGVTIGRGSIIAAGSVVTKSVIPYAIVGGNPARLLTMRFDEEKIREHEEIVYGRRVTGI